MPPKPSEKRQVVRFAFYKLDSAWRRLPAERQASAKLEFGGTSRSFAGRLLLRPYGLVGIRCDCDFLLWQVAEDLDSLVALQTPHNRTDLRAYLAVPYSYLAMTRRSIYEFPEDPSQPSRLVIRPSEARYLFVYPFIKTRAWYMLPKAERQTMMDEHVRIGRKYPSIRLNTTYSYGLDDQEFIVVFEGDNPSDFLDLVMELRESKASSYTLKDTHTYTCVQMSLCDMLDTLGGAGSAQATSRTPARADGYAQVATPAALPARAQRRHTGVVHAAGRSLPARIPLAAAEALITRAVPQARAGRAGHVAAGRAAGGGRGHPVRRYPAAVRAAGTGSLVLSGGRTADHPAYPGGRPGARAATGGSCDRPRVCDGNRPGGVPGAAPARPAHRIRGSAVHTRELRDRRRRDPHLHADQALHVHRAARLARADATVRGARGRLPRGPGPCRRPGLAAVRQLGRLPVAGGLRDLRVSAQPAHTRARGRERRAGDPFRDGYGHAARGFRAGGRRRDRRRLAGSARRRVGADRVLSSPRHSGQPRSGRAPGAAAGARAPGTGRARPRRRAAGAHLQPGARRSP